MASFRYQPLDEDEDSLRLLTLQPGTADIHCTLENRTFASKPQYETLSYTWGTGAANKTIYVDEQPFFVRENLFDALRYLRQPTPRVLWIDAICIDQTNIPERNYQVTLMSFVYSRCLNVLVWLNVNLEESNDYGGATGTSRLRWVVSDKKNGQQIVNHPYWTRVWVMQELILPKEIKFLVDKYPLEEQEFNYIVTTINDDKLHRKFRSIQELRKKKATEQFRLEQLIRTFNNLQCTEKRDGIFGFLGLAHGYTIDVDYGAGFFEIYRQLIDFHQATEPDHEDWQTCDEFDRAAKLMHFSELVQTIFNGAVDKERRVAKPSELSENFTVVGATVSRILHLGPTYTEMLSSMQAEKAWRQARLDHFTSQADLPAFLDADRRFTAAVLDWDEARLDRMRNVLATESHAYRTAPCRDPLAVRAAYADMSDAGETQRFIGTRGFFGMAPPGAQVGDAIALFMDCDSYVILRPTDTDRWMIVGKAVGTMVKMQSTIEPNATEAVRYSSTYFQGSQNTKWDNGEGHFNGQRNKIVLELDLDTLQQLTN